MGLRNQTEPTAKVVVIYVLYGSFIQNLSHFLILPHHCTKNHQLLIYRLDISRTERNSCYASCNPLKFLILVSLSYEFLKLSVSGVK